MTGRIRIRFGRFPFLLGQTLQVRFLGPRLLARAESLTFTLRCIVAEVEQDDQGRPQRALHQIYADSRSLSPDGHAIGARVSLDLAFPLPRGDYQTCLGIVPLRYWELHVQAGPPLSAYRATFLVPVYAERR
jgi:hypothetical protein